MNIRDKVRQLAKETPFTEESIAGSILADAEQGLPLNLQFFGGDGGGDGDDSGTNGGENPGKNGDSPEDNKKIELTQEELDKKIESEADRKLNSALQKKQQEWDSQLQEKIDSALEEQKRLSKLSEEERKNEELSIKEKKLLEREAEIARKELLSDAKDDLVEKGLPTSFAEVLLGENAEKTLENINNFKTAFDEAVNAAVKEKLRQDTPPAGSGLGKGTNVIAELRNKQDQSKNKAPDPWA